MNAIHHATAINRWPVVDRVAGDIATVILICAVSIVNHYRAGPRLQLDGGTVHDPTLDDPDDLRLVALQRDVRRAVLAATFALMLGSLALGSTPYAAAAWLLLVAWLVGYFEALDRLAVAPGGDA